MADDSMGPGLDDVALDPDARIGPPDAGAGLVFGVVAPTFLAGLAAVNVGIAQSAVSAAVAHATSRHDPDGGSLAELPTIRHTLADMAPNNGVLRTWMVKAPAGIPVP